jgi:hypothetical protein
MANVTYGFSFLLLAGIVTFYFLFGASFLLSAGVNFCADYLLLPTFSLAPPATFLAGEVSEDGTILFLFVHS